MKDDIKAHAKLINEHDFDLEQLEALLDGLCSLYFALGELHAGKEAT
jgi:hypothetical protein